MNGKVALLARPKVSVAAGALEWRLVQSFQPLHAHFCPSKRIARRSFRAQYVSHARAVHVTTSPRVLRVHNSKRQFINSIVLNVHAVAPVHVVGPRVVQVARREALRVGLQLKIIRLARRFA